MTLSTSPNNAGGRLRAAEQRYEDAAQAAGVTADLVSLLEAAVKALESVRRLSSDPYAEIDPASRMLLEHGGLSFAPLEAGETTAIEQTAAEMAALRSDSGTVREVAARMRVTDGRVRQLLRARVLLGLTDGDAWRIPWFQFAGARPVPGLDRVLVELPEAIHPVAVYHFLSRPNPDLEVEGQPVSPLAWLRTGADPRPVAAIAADL